MERYFVGDENDGQKKGQGDRSNAGVYKLGVFRVA